jgi:hypothetical protein
MAFDFPASPSINQLFTPPGGPTYIYTGSGWATQVTGPTVSIGDSPPTSVPNGSLWWESDTGKFFIRYDDGTSVQWVTATSPVGATGNVLSSGSPTAGQLAVWTGPNTLQGAASPESVGASRVLLATINPSGAAQAVIGPGVLTSTYEQYEIEYSVFNNTGTSQSVAVQFSTDGGTTWISPGYESAAHYTESNAASVYGAPIHNGSYFYLIPSNNDQSLVTPAVGSAKLYRPSVSGLVTSMIFETAAYNGGRLWYSDGAGSLPITTVPINAILLFWASGGNYGANSKIKVYGLR